MPRSKDVKVCDFSFCIAHIENNDLPLAVNISQRQRNCNAFAGLIPLTGNRQHSFIGRDNLLRQYFYFAGFEFLFVELKMIIGIVNKSVNVSLSRWITLVRYQTLPDFA